MTNSANANIIALNCPKCGGSLDLSQITSSKTKEDLRVYRQMDGDKYYLAVYCSYCQTLLLISLDKPQEVLVPRAVIEKHTTIGSLAVGRSKPVYRRKGKGLYIKLNEKFHVKTKLSSCQKNWLGDGTAEELHPNEIVEVIQFSDGS
jgi:hypothetical protein